MCTSRVLNAHPVGMLDRDQRTTVTTETKSVQCDCAAGKFNNQQFIVNKGINCGSKCIEFCRCGGWCKKDGISFDISSKPICLNCCGYSSRKQQTNSYSIASRSFKLKNYKQPKFSDFLLVSICIWTLSLRLSSAKPFSMDDSILTDILNNPCNTHNENGNQGDELLRSYFDPIAFQSKFSLNKADTLVNDYLITSGMMQHFGSVERMHVELDHEKQDWLYSNGTDIPKKYKDTVPENICEELRSEHNQAGWKEFLHNSDIRMQRMVIGFHRIATTEKTIDMRNLFKTARDQAQAVLCEIRSIMNKVNLQYVLQTSEQLTDTDANDSWFNWVMLREYYNQLEYISEISNLIVKSEPA